MDIVSILEQWVNINSYSYHSEGVEKMLAEAEKSFSALNPDEVKKFSFGLFLKKRKHAPFQVFLGGHVDTVFPPDHPFQKAQWLDGKRLRGPGVADMKGGLLVLLMALLKFEASSQAPHLGWEIFLNGDEEIGSPHSTPFLQACAKRCQCALFFEPAMPDGSFVNKRKGSSSFLVTSEGKAAHCGRHPEEGKNAIYPLVHFIHEIESLNTSETLVNVGKIKGGIAANVIPEYAEALVNIRFYQDIEDILIQKAHQEGVHLQKLSFRPPKLFNENTKNFFSILKECGEKIKQEIKWKESGGVCDGNTFGAAGIPTIDTMGVIGGAVHTDQEFLYFPSLEKKIALTFLLLDELSKRRHL